MWLGHAGNGTPLSLLRSELAQAWTLPLPRTALDISSLWEVEIKKGEERKEQMTSSNFQLFPLLKTLTRMTCLADKTNHPVKRAESQ